MRLRPAPIKGNFPCGPGFAGSLSLPAHAAPAGTGLQDASPVPARCPVCRKNDPERRLLGLRSAEDSESRVFFSPLAHLAHLARMTDRKTDIDATPPCGFAIFSDGALLAAFPTEEKAREVLQECERAGYRTDVLAMHAIFLAPQADILPPGTPPRTELETELRQARIELATALRQRDELLEALSELRDRLA